jgi:hypothetical protein
MRPLKGAASAVFSPMILSRIGRVPGVIDRHVRWTWSVVEQAYGALPEWAQPIVSGFGLSIPPAIVAIGIWTVFYL